MGLRNCISTKFSGAADCCRFGDHTLRIVGLNKGFLSPIFETGCAALLGSQLEVPPEKSWGEKNQTNCFRLQSSCHTDKLGSSIPKMEPQLCPSYPRLQKRPGKWIVSEVGPLGVSFYKGSMSYLSMITQQGKLEEGYRYGDAYRPVLEVEGGSEYSPCMFFL